MEGSWKPQAKTYIAKRFNKGSQSIPLQKVINSEGRQQERKKGTKELQTTRKKISKMALLITTYKYYFKYKWVKFSNQKNRASICIKVRHNYMLPTIHSLILKDTHSLNVKRWKKIFQHKWKPKKNR